MNNRFLIAIGSFNNEKWVTQNLASIICQDYGNYEAIYFDDASTDNTGKIAQELITNEPKFTYYKPTFRMYKTWFFSTLERAFPVKDNDILVFVDGDDFLASENVLSYLNEVYNQTGCWMTYGGMRVWTGDDNIVEPYPQNSEIPEEVKRNKAYRKDTWRTSHLKTMRGFVWNAINKDDLKPNGKFMVGPDDLAIMFAALELCPPDKVYRVTDPIYLYNHSEENQKSRAFTDHKQTGIDFESIVRNRKPYDTLSFITPTLAGGLGNQMFEIAAAASLAKDNGAVLIVNNEEHILPNQGRNINNYTSNIFSKITFSNKLNIECVYKHDLCTYEKIFFKKNMKTMGHFQSYKYFDHNREYIQKLFTLPKDNKLTDDFTAIQVRRGDYYKFPDHHPQLTPEYYAKAVKMASPKRIAIFSDDIQWCKNNLKFDVEVSYMSDEDYKEMALMSQCSKLIISNSSFGWWAAYLNTRGDKKIYVPSIWFGRAMIAEGFNIDDLIPPDWIKVEV